jgi:hypothetical protein
LIHKRTITLCLFAIMSILILCACNANQNAASDTTSGSSSTAASSETSGFSTSTTNSETSELKTIKADQTDMTLSVPKSWDDTAVILTNSEISYSTSDSKDTLLFEIREKSAYTNNSSMGNVWGLYMFSKDAFTRRFGDVDPSEIVGANIYILGTDSDHVYLLDEPTDVQFLYGNQVSQAQYEQLQKESQTILEYFLRDKLITVNDKCPESACYRVETNSSSVQLHN